MSKIGHKPGAPFNRVKAEPAAYAAEEIYGIFEADGMRPYDMKEIIARIVDGAKFDEYKAEYGKTVICGLARIGGFAVGIVANQASPAQQTDPASGRKAHGVWRRDLYRKRGEGRALHHGLQPEPRAADFPA